MTDQIVSDVVRTTDDWEPYILELGERRLAYFGLDVKDWTIKFVDDDGNLDNGSAGFCYFRGKVIVLTREYLLTTDERNVEETILHEIAHVLATPEHTQEFYDKLKEIGGTGNWYGPDGQITTYPVKG